MTEPRTLSTAELDLILQGACFLGSGGGGPLALGRQFIDDIAKQGNPVRVVDVASVPPDATGAISAGRVTGRGRVRVPLGCRRRRLA